MSFATSSIPLRIAAVLGLLAALLHLVGFATPSWCSALQHNFGLWQACVQGVCVSLSNFSGFEARFHAVQAMETIGLLLLVPSAVGCIVFIFMEQFRTKPARLLLSMCMAGGAVAIEIGIAIFGARYPFLSYSFYLSLVGGIVAFVGTVFLFLDYRSASPYSPLL